MKDFHWQMTMPVCRVVVLHYAGDTKNDYAGDKKYVQTTRGKMEKLELKYFEYRIQKLLFVYVLKINYHTSNEKFIDHYNLS